MPEKPVEPNLAPLARFSWLFPLLAWLSQIILGLALSSASGLGAFWMLVAVGQLVLMVLGLAFSIKVLSVGRSKVPLGSWRSALLGLVLSGGSLLLIASLLFGILRP